MNSESAREELLERAESLKLLPTLGTIVDKIFCVLSDRNSSFNQLLDVVKYDHAMSSKIIGIANSGYYSRGVQIVAVERAMVAIGFEEIKNIVTCLVFLGDILKKLHLRERDVYALWLHSLKVACCAKVLAGATGEEDPEKAFTISLLHDVGKIVLHIYDEEYSQVLENAIADGNDVCEEERRRYGIDHQELGYYLSVKSRFPQELAGVIRGHHNESDNGDGVLMGVVRKADLFALFPDSLTGAEAEILAREHDFIEKEMARIREVMGTG